MKATPQTPRTPVQKAEEALKAARFTEQLTQETLKERVEQFVNALRSTADRLETTMGGESSNAVYWASCDVGRVSFDQYITSVNDRRAELVNVAQRIDLLESIVE